MQVILGLIAFGGLKFENIEWLYIYIIIMKCGNKILEQLLIYGLSSSKGILDFGSLPMHVCGLLKVQ